MHFVKAKGILSQNNGMNIYRGCSHGCIYCDSRSRCYGFTHAFENIEVKENAPELLEHALRTKRKKCMIGTGAMCDPYLHIEEKLRLARKCLELIDQYEYGVTLRDGDREYYYNALDQHFPGLKQRYIRTYGNAYQLPGPRNKELSALVINECKKHNILYTPEECFAYLHEMPEKYTQLSLF